MAVLAAGLALAGCSDPAAPKAAPGGDSAACSQLLGRLPATVDGHARGSSDPAGTAVWGGTAIGLRCGQLSLAPADPCQTVDDVDWLVHPGDAAVWFGLYGRRPGVVVRVDHSIPISEASNALLDLTTAITPIPVVRRCPS